MPKMDKDLANTTDMRSRKRIIHSPGTRTQQMMAMSKQGSFRDLWTASPSAMAMFQATKFIGQMLEWQCETLIDDDDLLQKLAAEKFDIAISEASLSCGFGLFDLLKIPATVGVTSNAILESTSYAIGEPLLLSYVPGLFSASGEKTNIVERLQNVIAYRICLYMMRYHGGREMEVFRKKYGMFRDYNDTILITSESMPRFHGKVAIITGSSSGIGAATAVLFAKEGARVTITGRKQHGLEATKKAMIEVGAHSEDINVVQADVTDAHGRKRIISSTVQKFGRLDILVNNAGGTFLSPDGSAGLKASTDLLKKTMDVNVYSVVELIQSARPYLVSSKGEIVNVSSIAGLPTAYAKIPYYAMSKAALDQMMRAVAIELIAEGVRVNNVSPGGVMTNIAQNSGVPDDVAAKFYASYARNPFEVPSGRIADPSEIATIIAFLADRSQSSYIVGQTIVADGGNSIVLASNADVPMKKSERL